MKKLLMFIASAFIAVNAFCGPFGDLIPAASSGSSKDTVATGTIPEGKEILPVLVYYSENVKPSDKKILSQNLNLNTINVFDNKYDLEFSYSYKAGFITARRIAKMLLEVESGTFSVNVVAMVNVTDTSKTNCTSRDMKMTADQFASEISDLFKSISNDDYAKYSGKAFSSLKTLKAVNDQASNKIKAKKWFEAHDIKGQKVSEKVLIRAIEESDLSGFAYKITGYGGLTVEEANREDSLGEKNTILNGMMARGITVYFYSNDDKVIDAKNGSVIEVTGTITKTNFIDKDTYKLSSVQIVE